MVFGWMSLCKSIDQRREHRGIIHCGGPYDQIAHRYYFGGRQKAVS